MFGGRWVLLGLAVTMGVATACIGRGEDDESGDPPDTTEPSVDETATRIASWFTDQSDSNGLQFTAAEADCAAQEVVHGLGVTRIEELRTIQADEFGNAGDGVDVLQEPPLEADEADLVYKAMTGCIDFTAQMTDVLVDNGTPPAAARCMAVRYLATDVPRRAIMAAETDPELMGEINATLSDVAAACDV
jgi:hypothetical protein